MNTIFAGTLVLSGAQVLLGFLSVAAVLGGVIWMAKGYFMGQSNQIKGEHHRDLDNSMVRKYDAVDYKSHESNIKLTGLVAALVLVIIALAWTQFSTEKLLGDLGFEPMEMEIDIPPTTQPQKLPALPPPPTPESLTFEPIDEPLDEPDPEPIKDIELDPSPTPSSYTGPTDPNANLLPPVAPAPPPPPEPVVDPIPTDNILPMAEIMPLFPSCEEITYDEYNKKKACADRAFMSFVYDNIKYPEQAREIGLEGTAVVSFVVRKDGSIDGYKIIRDPGAGMGREALRVVKLMNKMGKKWLPGKQRGRPVSVRFNMPVRFKLSI